MTDAGKSVVLDRELEEEKNPGTATHPLPALRLVAPQ
jgi:hypothetical protein